MSKHTVKTFGDDELLRDLRDLRDKAEALLGQARHSTPNPLAALALADLLNAVADRLEHFMQPREDVAGETWDFTDQTTAQRRDSKRQLPFCYHDGRNVVDREHAHDSDVFPLYRHPQDETREALSEYEIACIYETPEISGSEFESPTKKAIAIARAVEKAHGITGGIYE